MNWLKVSYYELIAPVLPPPPMNPMFLKELSILPIVYKTNDTSYFEFLESLVQKVSSKSNSLIYSIIIG